MNNSTRTSTAQNLARWLLGGFMVFAGIGHLSFARQEFQAQVPKWLPMNPDTVVLASGVVEIALGLALLFWASQRVRMGWLLAVFFVLVFPGNLSQYVHRIDAFGLNTDTARLMRLFFQPVLVAWALWCTGAWQSWRKNA